MSGFISQKSAIGLKVQADSETRNPIVAGTDTYPAANARNTPDVFTQTNPEFQGTVHAVGDVVLGRAYSGSMDFLMRGPGGSAPPALDAWVPGRALRAVGFEEIRSATALISTEALGGASDNTGATTKVTLGASASSTDDEYIGYPIVFSDQGSGVAAMSSIVAYNGSTKEATLANKYTTAPAANYSIPAFLGYRLQASFTELYLTHDRWHDKKRYNQENCQVSQMQISLQTNSRNQTTIPVMNVGLTGDYSATAEVDETSPAVLPLANPSPVRDGDFWFNGVAVGGAGMTYDHGIQIGYPPNPNKQGGNDAPCIIQTTRTLTLDLNEVPLTTQDRTQLAEDQGQHPVWFRYGNNDGRIVSMTIPAARPNFSDADPSGEFVTRQVPAFIDGSEKAVCIFFPYLSL